MAPWMLDEGEKGEAVDHRCTKESFRRWIQEQFYLFSTSVSPSFEWQKDRSLPEDSIAILLTLFLQEKLSKSHSPKREPAMVAIGATALIPPWMILHLPIGVGHKRPMIIAAPAATASWLKISHISETAIHCWRTRSPLRRFFDAPR